MDKELQEYYESAFDMMSSRGWKDLLEDLTKLRDEVDNIKTAIDAQQLYFRQGQLDILDLILNRRQTCGEVYEQLKEESL